MDYRRNTPDTAARQCPNTTWHAASRHPALASWPNGSRPHPVAARHGRPDKRRCNGPTWRISQTPRPPASENLKTQEAMKLRAGWAVTGLEPTWLRKLAYEHCGTTRTITAKPPTETEFGARHDPTRAGQLPERALRRVPPSRGVLRAMRLVGAWDALLCCAARGFAKRKRSGRPS